MSIKSEIRNINLSLLTDEYDITFDVSKRKSSFQFLKKNYKLIKYVTKLGGVLTGSRALKCYSVNNVNVLDRSPNDWDFLITKEMAYNIFDHFSITSIPETDRIISIRKCRWSSLPDYGGDRTRYGVVDVHLIIVDDLPEYNEEKSIRISNLSYIIGYKTKMLEEDRKHGLDLTQIIIRFNNLLK